MLSLEQWVLAAVAAVAVVALVVGGIALARISGGTGVTVGGSGGKLRAATSSGAALDPSKSLRVRLRADNGQLYRSHARGKSPVIDFDGSGEAYGSIMEDLWKQKYTIPKVSFTLAPEAIETYDVKASYFAHGLGRDILTISHLLGSTDLTFDGPPWLATTRVSTIRGSMKTILQLWQMPAYAAFKNSLPSYRPPQYSDDAAP